MAVGLYKIHTQTTFSMLRLVYMLVFIENRICIVHYKYNSIYQSQVLVWVMQKNKNTHGTQAITNEMNDNGLSFYFVSLLNLVLYK